MTRSTILLLTFLTLLSYTHSHPLSQSIHQLTPTDNWKDSYSVNGKCYCISNYDHGIRSKKVDTPQGKMTVFQVCELIGPGPGVKDNPIYNDIQCGNGPENDAGDEVECPGRVDMGTKGCKIKGPKWDLSFLKKKKEEVNQNQGKKNKKIFEIPGKIQAELFSDMKGIRLENTTDSLGGKNVAYIKNGEYVEYNVDVMENGNYNAMFRVASKNGGGTIRVLIDDKNMTEFNVDKTNDWQNWYTEKVGMKLKKGRQVLKLAFEAQSKEEGYLLNVNWMEFQLA